MLKVFEVKTDSGRWFFHKDSIIGVSDVYRNYVPGYFFLEVYCIGNTVGIKEEIPQGVPIDLKELEDKLYRIQKEILEILEERDADC